jgi:hypothetical protein
MGMREYFEVLALSERGILAVRELLHAAFLALLDCCADDETYRIASHQDGVANLVRFIHTTASERVESEKGALTKGWNSLAFAPNVSPHDAFAHAEIQYMMYCLAAGHAYDSAELMQKVVDLLSEVSPYRECAFSLRMATCWVVLRLLGRYRGITSGRCTRLFFRKQKPDRRRKHRRPLLYPKPSLRELRVVEERGCLLLMVRKCACSILKGHVTRETNAASSTLTVEGGSATLVGRRNRSVTFATRRTTSLPCALKSQRVVREMLSATPARSVDTSLGIAPIASQRLEE